MSSVATLSASREVVVADWGSLPTGTLKDPGSIRLRERTGGATAAIFVVLLQYM